MGSTGPWLLTRTPPSRRLHHSSPSRNKLLDSVCSPPQPILPTCRGSSSRCTPSSSSQQSPTSEDDCLRHSWHREVLPHPLPPTSPAAPGAGCSSNWCGRLQHRWPDPPLSPQPAREFKDLEGERLTKLQQRSSTSSLTRCRWWGGRSSARLTDVSARPSPFGGCSCLLFGEFGLPLYTTDSRSELSDQGRAAYQTFQQAVVLDQVMRQAGQDQTLSK